MNTPGIILGLSGGVDSSVAGLLLQTRAQRGDGPEVAGLFMRNWADDDSGTCRAEADRRDAVRVAGQLGMPLHFRDFSAEYHAQVFQHLITEYAAGRTPNPDVLCNREIKFAHFLEAARALGADRIATGHYARITHANGHWQLRRAVDRNKDQSYFLHQLGQAQLAVTEFPLGHLHKPEVRTLAEQAGLATAGKKDSTGICFIGARDFREFLARWLPAQPGPIQTPDGHCIGEHPGVFYFTLGQREGLQLGGVRGYRAAPWYVTGKDIARNILYVDQGHDSPWLSSHTLWSETMHWISNSPPARRFSCQAQTRYRQPEEPCEVSIMSSGSIVVHFQRPQWAVTPGQSVVLYQGDECLGGAVIARTDARCAGHGQQEAES